MARRSVPTVTAAYDARFMRRRSRIIAAAMAMVAVAMVAVALSPGLGSAALAKSKSKSPPTTVPQPGWLVDRVRFEPLDQRGEIDVPGVGAYRGAIEGRPSAGGGGVELVNEVGLDDYVRGVAEVPSSWPAEALAAQAIAARTYALYQVGTGRDLCATESCQVYVGLAKERGDATGAWAAAVAATANQVLLYKNRPILAMYSSSNGGQSVVGSQPYLRPAKDPDDAVSPLNHWQSTVPFSTLTDVFTPPGPVVGIMATDHDTMDLAWQAPDGTVSDQEVPVADFVVKLNGGQPAPDGLPMLLPSSRFGLLVDPAAATVTFDGHGFGHGVGMSQYGALGKALRGMHAPDILAAYYSGLRPTIVPAQVLPKTLPVTVAAVVPATTVTSPGWFRVKDGHGTVLATAASGYWRIVPAAGGKVRVLPPDDQGGALAVAAGEPPGVGTAEAVEVHFRLSVPALVRVTLAPPGGSPARLPERLMAAGDGSASLLLPDQFPRLGTWTAVVSADAGGGRAVEAPISFLVGPPTASAISADAAAGGGSAGALPAVHIADRRLAAVAPRRAKELPAWLVALGIWALAGATTALGVDLTRLRRLRIPPPVD